MFPIEINTMEEFINISSIGFKPLIDYKRFIIAYNLRNEIELRLFGKAILGESNIPLSNQKYYKYAYENTLIKCCEECAIQLPDFKAIYVSHILARGGYPELAHDLRNFNLLCPRCHRRWEINNSGMKIRKRNKKKIKLMLNDLRL